MLSLKNIASVPTVQHDYRSASSSRECSAGTSTQLASYDSSPSTPARHHFGERDAYGQLNQSQPAGTNKHYWVDTQRRRLSGNIERRSWSFSNLPSLNTGFPTTSERLSHSPSIGAELLARYGKDSNVYLSKSKGKVDKGKAIAERPFSPPMQEAQTPLSTISSEQQRFSEVCNSFLNCVARLDKDGLIIEMEDSNTNEGRPPSAEETGIHQHCMDILEALDFFSSSTHLSKIGVVSEEANAVFSRATEETLPYLSSRIELKKNVAMMLTICPDLYQKINDTYDLYKYLSEASPFDRSAVRQRTFARLIQEEDELLKTGELNKENSVERLYTFFSEEEVALNYAYKNGLEQLSRAQTQFKEALYSPRAEKGSVMERAWELKDLSDLNKEEKIQAYEERAGLIEMISAAVQDYLVVLVAAMKEIEQQGGGCLVPAADSVAVLEKQVMRYLSHLQADAKEHLKGTHNFIGQKKVKFAELIDSFEKCNWLPVEEKYDDLSIMVSLTEKVERTLQSVAKRSQAWALDTIADLFKKEYGSLSLLTSEEAEQQANEVRALEKYMNEKLALTDELPTFSGRDSQPLQECVDFFENSGVFYTYTNSDVEDEEEINQKVEDSLCALVQAKLLSPVVSKEIREAPAYMHPYLLKALDIKKTFAAQLIAHPELFSELEQIKDLHNYIATQAFFDANPQKLKEINDLGLLNKKISVYLRSKEVGFNQVYRENLEKLEEAEQRYYQTLFMAPPSTADGVLSARGMSLWDHACQLKHLPKDISKVPQAHQDFLDKRVLVLESIIKAIREYVDVVEAVLKNIEQHKGNLSLISYADFSEKVSECEKKCDRYAQKHFSDERNFIGRRRASFSDVLRVIKKADFLPSEYKTIHSSLVLPIIKNHIDEVNKFAQRYADQWVREVAAKVIAKYVAADTEQGIIEQSGATLLEAHKMAVKHTQQAIEERVEELKQEQIKKFMAEAKATHGENFFATLARVFEMIEVNNAIYDNEVAYYRYRYAVSAVHNMHSRGYSDDNTDFFYGLLHAVHAYSGNCSGSGADYRSSQTQPLAHEGPGGESSQALSTYTYDAAEKKKARSAAHYTLCSFFNLDWQKVDVASPAFSQAHKKTMLLYHPDRNTHLDIEQRKEREATAKMINGLVNIARGN